MVPAKTKKSIKKNNLSYGHVQLLRFGPLRFEVVKNFWSCSNLDLVKFIRSCELASSCISKILPF